MSKTPQPLRGQGHGHRRPRGTNNKSTLSHVLYLASPSRPSEVPSRICRIAVADSRKDSERRCEWQRKDRNRQIDMAHASLKERIRMYEAYLPNLAHRKGDATCSRELMSSSGGITHRRGYRGARGRGGVSGLTAPGVEGSLRRRRQVRDRVLRNGDDGGSIQQEFVRRAKVVRHLGHDVGNVRGTETSLVRG